MTSDASQYDLTNAHDKELGSLCLPFLRVDKLTMTDWDAFEYVPASGGLIFATGHERAILNAFGKKPKTPQLSSNSPSGQCAKHLVI